MVLLLGLVPSLIHCQGPHSKRLRFLISGTSEKQAPRGMRHGQVSYFLHDRTELRPEPSRPAPQPERSGQGWRWEVRWGWAGQRNFGSVKLEGSQRDSCPFSLRPLPESSHGIILFLSILGARQ